MARTTSSTPADFKASICTTRKKKENKKRVNQNIITELSPKICTTLIKRRNKWFSSRGQNRTPQPNNSLGVPHTFQMKNQTSMSLRVSHLLRSQCLTPWRPKLQTLKPTHVFQHNPEAIHILQRKKKILLLLYGNVCKNHASLHHYSAFCDFWYGSA